MDKKPLILVSPLLTLVFLIAACVSDSTPAPQINQVSSTAMDYGFSGPQFIPSGMTEMVMTNTGAPRFLLGMLEEFSIQ